MGFLRKLFGSTKAGPSYFEGASSSSENNDVVNAVLGVTGSGKTSFIRTATGNSSIAIGNGLLSDTLDLKAYYLTHRNVKYVLVDTPGFNDSTMSNDEVTAKIILWLESSYSSGTRLSSIIYIHDIMKPRMEGSAVRNMRFFRKLIKENAFLNVTLATSFWDLLPSENVGIRRESDLKQSKDFWADMVAKGSEVVRIRPDRNHCLQILEQVAARARKISAAFPTRQIETPKDELQETRERLKREKRSEKENLRKILEEQKLNNRREMQRLQAQDEAIRQSMMQEKRNAEARFQRDMEEQQMRRQQELEQLRHEAYLRSERQRKRDADQAQRERERQREYEKVQKQYEAHQKKQREVQRQIEYEESQRKQRQSDYDQAQEEKQRLESLCWRRTPSPEFPIGPRTRDSLESVRRRLHQTPPLFRTPSPVIRTRSPSPAFRTRTPSPIRWQCSDPNFFTTTHNGSCYGCGSFHDSRDEI